MRRLAICAVLAIIASLACSAGPVAAEQRPPQEPRIAIPRTQLEGALHCHSEIAAATREPVLFVTGTGAHPTSALKGATS